MFIGVDIRPITSTTLSEGTAKVSEWLATAVAATPQTRKEFARLWKLKTTTTNKEFLELQFVLRYIVMHYMMLFMV